MGKYKETNAPEVTILYDECSEIINAGYVIPKILEELKENGLIYGTHEPIIEQSRWNIV